MPEAMVVEQLANPAMTRARRKTTRTSVDNVEMLWSQKIIERVKKSVGKSWSAIGSGASSIRI